MKAVVAEQEPVAASEDERRILEHVEQLIEENQTRPLCLVGLRGEQIELPETASGLLRQLVHLLAQGQVVTLVPLHRQMTTQEAAEILNVSRPYLIRLLDRGEMPFTKTGTHRRILFEDLMAYKQVRDANRRQGLARLTQLSQELGLYDEDLPDPLIDEEEKASEGEHADGA